MSVKMNLRIIRKNQAEIRFLTKLISRPYDRAMAMTTAWELRNLLLASVGPLYVCTTVIQEIIFISFG